MKLILIRGLPGSGKSTMAKAYCYDNDSLFYEADMFHYRNGKYEFDVKNLGVAHEWCQKMTIEGLIDKYNVVVANTFTTLKEMKPYFDIAEKTNSELEIIEAKGDFGSIHNVPKETIDKMRSRWEDIE